MKAIPTFYRGYRFRSRTEAKWDVFLDNLFWSWEFEPEGYVLPNGVPYLIDFYIKEIDTWIEVKGKPFTEEEIEKCRQFSLGEPKSTVMMVSGLPARVKYPCFCNGELMDATLTTYIRAKGWTTPYFGGDWWDGDAEAFAVAPYAKFEHGKKGTN